LKKKKHHTKKKGTAALGHETEVHFSEWLYFLLTRSSMQSRTMIYQRSV